MSETKFTKGDWRVTDSSFVYALNNNGVNQFTCLVQTSMSGADNTEIKANAHLIAAAPEMHNEIERDIDWLTRMIDTHGDNHSMAVLFKEMRINKLNLLAKARGEK